MRRSGIPLAEIHPQLANNNGMGPLKLEPFSWDLLKDRGVDVLFLATPHEQSRAWVPEALAHGLRVIDLSGAWRLIEARNRAVYGFEDEGIREGCGYPVAGGVRDAGACIARRLLSARLVANPGCYATSVILALRPLVAAGLVDVEHGIVADSKSGVSGAGKAPTAKTHFMYAADNLSAYGVFRHRHTGELLEQIGIGAGDIVFTPHLLPIPRGILSTIYVHFQRAADTGKRRTGISRVLRRQPDGAHLRERAPADSVFGAGRTTPTSDFSLRRMGSAQ